MKNHLYISAWLIFLFLITGCSLNSRTEQSSCASNIDEEEYKVCSSAIFKYFSRDLPFLNICQDSVPNDETFFKPSNEISTPWNITEENEITADFKKNNNKSYKFCDKFKIDNKRVIILSSAELSKIFKGDDIDKNWEFFHQKYGMGLISLSRAGFNNARNKAAVYIEFANGGLNASGNIVILEKIDDNWKVIKIREIWISYLINVPTAIVPY